MKSVEHAKKLYGINGNTLWIDVINREREKLKVAFDVLEDGAKITVDRDKISCKLVFDARMKLERKSRWEKDGYRDPGPE